MQEEFIGINMALNADFFISLPLDQYFVNQNTGLPLSNGYLVFKRDSARNTFKPVYELNGSPGNYSYAALPNPLPLSGAGTPINASDVSTVIYYYPYDSLGNVDLYYIEAYSENDEFQWARQAWPNITEQSSPLNSNYSLLNQITNPQFTNVFLDDNLNTLTVLGATKKVFPIAPNWDLIISGSGSVSVQRFPVSGNDNVITSPPYVLDISVSSGIAQCLLQQTMNANSGLWSSTPNQPLFLSGLFVAENQNSGTTSLSMYYEDSNNSPPVLIMSGSFTNGQYSLKSGVTPVALPISLDTNSGKKGFVNIYFNLLPDTHIRISSIQVVPAATTTPPQISTYDAQTSNHELAYQGSWYIPNLNEKRIPSLLVGWDFPLNPRQFGTNHTISSSADYIWDQTIAADLPGTATVTNDPVSNGLKITTNSANDAFYILQYLDGDTVSEILSSALSVNVNAYTSGVGAPVKMRIYLCKGVVGSVFPTLVTTIGTLSSDGSFTVNASDWSLIDRSGLGIPTVDLTTVVANGDINLNTDYAFNQWKVANGNSPALTKFAIVVTFAYTVPNTVVTINSISVNLGNIPSRPAPQTPENVLSQCEYYYETSYPIGVVPGSINTSNAITVPVGASFVSDAGPSTTDINLLTQSFTTILRTIKRTSGYTFTLYNPVSGANSSVEGFIGYNGILLYQDPIITGVWHTINYTGVKSISLIGYGGIAVSHTQPGILTGLPTAFIIYHYVADARIGIV